MSNSAGPSTSSNIVLRPYAEVQIMANARDIAEAIRDTTNYPTWNSFVPSVKIISQPDGANTSRMVIGTDMLFNVNMTKVIKVTSREMVDTIEEPSDAKTGAVYRINWTFANAWHTPRSILRARRFNEIEVLDGGLCLYRTWSEFEGLAATIAKWQFGKILQQRFGDWARDLKSYVEKS